MSRVETRTPLPPGAVVRSLRGRDRGRPFLVLQDQGRRVVVADGDIHPVQRAKLKNPRHVTLIMLPPAELTERLRHGTMRDEEVRQWLRRLLAEGGGGEGGQG
jgi:hypothetical protein